MRRLCLTLALLTAMISTAASVRSYTLQFVDTSSRTQIKWPTNTINVAFSTSLNAPPSNVKAGSDVVGALRRALASWSEAADIDFVESWSKEQSLSASGSKGDGVSLITIAATQENTLPFGGGGDDMAGRTRIFFNRSGSITEADIVLNPSQQFSTDGTIGTFDLEATFVHEIGHLLGLEHSGAVGATMQPRQGKNGIYSLPAFTPRTLADDDRAGVRATYGVRADSAQPRGSVTGTISLSSGTPAFGASVWAEEESTGRVAASCITLLNGTYRLENLRPGRYLIRVEALDGPVLAAEIASQRGAYSGLASLSPATFRTEEVGQVNVQVERVAKLNGQLSARSVQINPTLIGFNGQLSTLAVPLTPGRLVTVYVGGDGLNLKQLAPDGVSVTSPFLLISPGSIAQQQFGAGLSVISFDVMVSEDAPAGDYSVRLQSSTGEVAFIAGGLTIDVSEPANAP